MQCFGRIWSARKVRRDDNLRQYRLIPQAFRLRPPAIEWQTFRKISMRSTDLDRFQHIVQNDRRRYVTSIDYLVVLPVYGDEKRCHFKLDDERLINDEVFTDAMFRLFCLQNSCVSCHLFVRSCCRSMSCMLHARVCAPQLVPRVIVSV